MKKFIRFNLMIVLLSTFISSSLFSQSVMDGNVPDASNANLQTWLKAGSISGLSNNDAIVSWPDNSINGNDALPVPEKSIPLFQENAFTYGLPAVYFGNEEDAVLRLDGLAPVFSDMSASENKSFTVMMLVKIDDLGSSYAYMFCGNNDNDCNVRLGFAQYFAKYAIANYPSNAGSGLYNNGTATDSDWHLLSFVSDNGDLNLYMDGSATSIANFTNPVTNTFDIDIITLGARRCGWTGEGLSGSMAEILIYDKSLSTTEIGEVYTYIDAKYFQDPGLMLLNSNPANNSEVADTTNTITLNFNSNTDGNSVANNTTITGSGVTGVSYASGDGTTSITLNILGTLEVGQTYDVVVASATTATNGDTMQNDHSFSFGVYSTDHPFLLVTEDMYAELRTRSATEPWATWKADAIAYVNDGANQVVSSDFKTLGQLVGKGALAYILDPDNKEVYKDRVRDALLEWQTEVNGIVAYNHEKRIIPSTAFFNSVIAFDIIYDDLTSTEQNNITSYLQAVSDAYESTGTGWPLNRLGTVTLWALFTRDDNKIETYKTQYKDELYSQISPDGVQREGPTYSGSRLMYNRFAKSYTMDVLEFTGKDVYYTDQRFIDFNEWQFGYSISPFKRQLAFGDGSWNGDEGLGHIGGMRAYRFSEQAAKYAASSEGIRPSKTDDEFHLVAYLLVEENFPEAERGASRIFDDGGAYFNDTTEGNNSIAAAVLCHKESYDIGGHMRYDNNSVSLNAFGTPVVTNPGYYHWGDSFFGITWDDYHASALYQNTLTINNEDHVVTSGGGISEGITSELLDYASASSGSALPNGTHNRNMIMMHPDGAAEGYFVLFDEVEATTTSHQAEIRWQPFSGISNVISADTEFSWELHDNVALNSGTGNYANIFLATPPASVTTYNGLVIRWQNTFEAAAIKPVYDTDGNGAANIATVIFPNNSEHTKGTMTRISGAGYTGATVDHGSSIIDNCLASDGVTSIDYSGLTIQGMSSMYRTNNSVLDFYFVRQGSAFYNTGINNVGFESTADISAYMKDRFGTVVSPSAEVTFYYPSLFSVSIDGIEANHLSSGTDWITVDVPAGSHDIELFTATSSDDIEVKIENNLITNTYPNPFTGSTNISISESVEGDIALQVFDIAGNMVIEQDCTTNSVVSIGESLNSGVYMVKLISANKSQNIKIIKL